MTKPSFEIDIAPSAQSSLAAHLPLAVATAEGCYHHAQNFRLPFGIYNVSLARICDKLMRLCTRLETYFAIGHAEGVHDQGASDVMQEVVDYIELSLYAAAEHVDDIDSIASGYFANSRLKASNPAYKSLEKQMKLNKRFVSAAANAIKHQQSRIRIFTLDYRQGGTLGCLHGYFLEGVEAGVVCPSSTFHQSQEVFSVTTLVWEIIAFLLASSNDLARFLKAIGSRTVHGPVQVQASNFASAVAAAARLPLYTFGEQHPFSRIDLRIRSSDGNIQMLRSALLGTISTRWSQNFPIEFGQQTSRFSGDGVSRSFRFVQPKAVVLQHWT
ncbi:hypothetical protein [Ralstonia sp.]|uniref:hypothetical protein n=1 Tax=Ralstonia sp. TaxID=54061 RepID=UPI0031E15EA2